MVDENETIKTTLIGQRYSFSEYIALVQYIYS